MGKENRWLIFLCAGRICLSLIFTSYSAVLPFVAAEWKMSSAQAGSVQSAWHGGYLISLFVAGFLADRFGAKKTLIRMSMASAAASTAFAFFSRSYLSALVLFGIAGLCSGGSYTPGLKLIFERTAPRSKGAMMGFFLASGSIGYALALWLSAWVIPNAGWRAALGLCALVTVLGAATMLFSLRPVPETLVNTSRPQEPENWSGLFRNRAAMSCILAYTFHAWELLGMWAWLPSFIIQTQAAFTGRVVTFGLTLAAISHLASSLGSIIGGRLSDIFGRSFVMLVMSLASLSCSFSIGWLYGEPRILFFVLVIVYNLFAIGDSAVYSTALAEVVPAHRLGAAYSFRSVLGFGAGAISPWIFGVVLDFGQLGLVTKETAWGLSWTSLALGALPGIVMIRWFRKLVRQKVDLK
ncbi:MAG: MFS transporter [Candidatus Tectomicrobia bacterium]|uniref:MFS transporter n=1 Tax=Tectimicrobiota bacterium TaxID=2528274 RepID=A0A933GJV3_UNCTE|nr:MFS transporter [Candidatus Tectomicrobia bacterium]